MPPKEFEGFGAISTEDQPQPAEEEATKPPPDEPTISDDDQDTPPYIQHINRRITFVAEREGHLLPLHVDDNGRIGDILAGAPALEGQEFAEEYDIYLPYDERDTLKLRRNAILNQLPQSLRMDNISAVSMVLPATVHEATSHLRASGDELHAIKIRTFRKRPSPTNGAEM